MLPGCGQDAVMSDTTKSFGQEVQAESTHKFSSRQCHHLIEVSVAIVFVAEDHLLLIVLDNAMMTDGNIVRVASQVLNQTFFAATGRFSVNYPVFGMEMAE